MTIELSFQQVILAKLKGILAKSKSSARMIFR